MLLRVSVVHSLLYLSSMYTTCSKPLYSHTQFVYLFRQESFKSWPRLPSGRVRACDDGVRVERSAGTRAEEAVAAGRDCLSLVLRTQIREVPRDGDLHRSHEECHKRGAVLESCRAH